MKCWAQTALLVLVVVLGTGHLLAACGQKGDLYLPTPAGDSRP